MRVPPRKPIVAALLLLSAVLPQILGLGAFALAHDHAAGDSRHAAQELELARLLSHGHGHEEGVPEHEHELLPSPPSQLSPPQLLPAASNPTLSARLPGAPVLPAAVRPWEKTRATSTGPPLLQLHCILLI